MANTPKVPKPVRHLEVQYRVVISLLVAAIVYFSIFRSAINPSSVILLTWMGFAASAIILDWIIILRAHPKEFKKITTLDDASRTMIFIIVIGASLVSLLAILFLLKSSKNAPHDEVVRHILLVIASVILSWWLVHTIFTFRYAHMFYDTVNDDGTSNVKGGLEFPGGEKNPDFLDFVYFSFVLGMTFQVSDVEISDKQMRRLAWIHGLISFAFNTAIVALSINVISGLVGQ